MIMLRNFGLAVLVVCIAAFASGCGGGGGSAMTPVMECPPGQVGTYPDCMEPGPTDEQRIAEARNTLAGIVSNARNLAQTASSTAAAVQAHEDATADQIASALAHAGDAQAALAGVEGASSAGNAATTVAAAQSAVASARAALGDVTAAQSAVAAVQSAVNAVAEARRQREADEIALTGGSSLIRHLRDNRKVSDAVLGALAPASIVVGSTGGTSGTATYPYHKGDPSTVYPIPSNTDRGVLGVTVSVGTTPVSSDSQTGKISGSGRLSNGFDLKDGDRFATVYTDISVDTRVRQKTGNTASDDAVEDTTVGADDDGIDQRYQYVADDDYLLAGIWLDDSDAASPVLRAFGFGSQPLEATHDFCTAADVTNTTTLSRACSNATTGFDMIAGFVDENESTEATYRGGVNGAYFAGGKGQPFQGGCIAHGYVCARNRGRCCGQQDFRSNHGHRRRWKFHHGKH